MTLPSGSMFRNYSPTRFARSLRWAFTAVLAAASMEAQDTVSFAGGRVSFIPPPGFQRMSKEMVEKKYPRAHAPEYVFANEKTTVSIRGLHAQRRSQRRSAARAQDLHGEYLRAQHPGA